MPDGKTAERLAEQKRELDALIEQAARVRDQVAQHLEALQRAGNKSAPKAPKRKP